jgi:hypothetical protein
MGEVSEEPRILADTGRNPNGTFAVGHKSKGGRPRRLDFFTAAIDWAESAKTTPEKALAQVIGAAITAAIGGDIAAAKLIIERFCGKETDVLELQDPDAVIDKGVALRELASILATAAAKRN